VYFQTLLISFGPAFKQSVSAETFASVILLRDHNVIDSLGEDERRVMLVEGNEKRRITPRENWAQLQPAA
jgi:hypothetical protein